MVLHYAMNYQLVYLFNGSNNFELGRRVKVVPFLAKQKSQVARDVTPCYVHSHDAMWHGEAFVDGNCMRHPVAGIKHDACCSTGCVSECEKYKM